MEKLPELWYIKINKENVDVFNGWRSFGILSSNVKGYLLSSYRDGIGYHTHYIEDYPEFKTEISFEDFKIHVLKEAPASPIINNDYQIF